MLTGKKLDDNRLQKYKSQMEDSLNDIENVWLKDSQYLVGNEISVADLVGISEIEQPSKLNIITKTTIDHNYN